MRRTIVQTAVKVLLLVLLSGVVVLPGAAQDDAPAAHKAVLEQVYDEVFNAGDLDALDTLASPDYINHGYGDDLTRDGFKSTLSAIRAALPDFAAEVEVLIAEGDWAASRVIFSGTFENDWIMGAQTIPPTGEPVEWSLNVMHQFDKAGLLAEDFTAFDSLSLLTQLGASPVPPLIATLLTATERVPAVMSAPVDEHSTDDHKAAFLHVIEDAINNGDLTAIDDSMAEAHLTHEPFGNFSRDQFKQVIEGFRATVPDLLVTADAIVAEGDWLAARLTYTGTFANPVGNGILTIEPTNEPIRFIINVFVHYNADGVGIEDFKEYNRLGWIRQLGLLPATS